MFVIIGMVSFTNYILTMVQVYLCHANMGEMNRFVFYDVRPVTLT